MLKFKILLVVLLFFLQSSIAFAQQTAVKKIAAVRSIESIKIDGLLNEEVWKTAPVATDFIESRPVAGNIESATSQTEIFILYDNTSIYLAGYCYETSTDSIVKELVGRDVIGSNDYVGVVFDTYNDKINGTGFYLTPLGEQYDAKYSNVGGEDDSWDAVWYSATQITEKGWSFEMRIPYSALRFSKNISTWGINFIRQRNKNGRQYTWNPINPKVKGFVSQSGLLTNITNIEPPLRLSFSPYLSTNVNHYPYNIPAVKNATYGINGGMDVKYGINQNFTLDVTLIPDFGQVPSDKKVLNLTPFEVRYSENRPFFTEGTELFSKGNLFYSRRVGSQPLHKYDVLNNIDSNEVITNNPSESKLINATKFSGRTEKGLGIGIFNAITKPMYAEIQNNTTGDKRRFKTTSLTNYNILVLDQTLKNNSSISLVNTNVWRSGSDYDANVTAAMFDLYNKGSKYNFFGQATISQKMYKEQNVVGYAHHIGFGKTGGNFNFNLVQALEDDKFDKNDLGILYNNNSLEHELWMGYKFLKPTKWYFNSQLNFNMELEHRYTDRAYQALQMNINGNAKLKNLWQIGASTEYEFSGNDFYEPRVPGRYFKTSPDFSFDAHFSTNDAKKYFMDFYVDNSFRQLFNGHSYYVGWGQRYKFSDKFSAGTNFSFENEKNDVGFAGINSLNSQIIFSRRLRKTVENNLNLKYSFSNKAGITLEARHYWSQVNNKQFYNLKEDGTLENQNSFTANRDYNVNLFNIDMLYTWQFAPGSFFNIAWKNQIIDEADNIENGYFKNLNKTFGLAQNNNLSLKLLFYFDYLDLKKKL